MLSAYYWKEENVYGQQSTVSIAMEEAKRGESKISFYLLSKSIVEGEEGIRNSGIFATQMSRWFHKELLLKIDRGRKGREIRKKAGSLISEAAGEYGTKYGLLYGYILFVDQHIFIKTMEGMESFLINKRYSKGKITLLDREIKGTIQKGAGIFLTCMKEVDQQSMEKICELLVMGKNKNEKNMENRLLSLTQTFTEYEGGIYVIYE